MEIKDAQTYSDLIEVLRGYSAGDVDFIQYDPNGVFHLLLAAVDNISKNFEESDYEEFPRWMDERQHATLERILRAAIPLEPG